MLAHLMCSTLALQSSISALLAWPFVLSIVNSSCMFESYMERLSRELYILLCINMKYLLRVKVHVFIPSLFCLLFINSPQASHFSTKSLHESVSILKKFFFNSTPCFIIRFHLFVNSIEVYFVFFSLLN